MITVPYTELGYIDIEAVRKLTASTPFVFIIGARQCGKTYGITKSVLLHGEKTVFVRRTKEERLKFANEQLSPFQAIDKTVSGIVTNSIVTLIKDGDVVNPCGWVIDLNNAKKRGFTLPRFDALLYDEAIPETHAGKAADKTNSETFFQLLVTLFGEDARFQSAKNHPKIWIVGNSNAINAWIFRVFGIANTIEKMVASGKDVYISPQRALSIFLVSAPEHAERREQMPLMRAIANSDSKDMALHNVFQGDTNGVRGFPLSEFKALASFVDGYSGFTVWIHKRKRRPFLYITRNAYPAKHTMPNTEEAFLQLGKATAFKSKREFWYMVLHANSGTTAFYDSVESKEWFNSMRKG